jgi:hypothetical protein
MRHEMEPKYPQGYYEDLKQNNPKKLHKKKQAELTLDEWWSFVPHNGSVIEVTDVNSLNFTNGLAMAASGCLDPYPNNMGICVFRKGKGNIIAKRNHYITVIDGGKVYILGQFDPFCDHHYYSLPENDTYRQIISSLI